MEDDWDCAPTAPSNVHLAMVPGGYESLLTSVYEKSAVGASITDLVRTLLKLD